MATDAQCECGGCGVRLIKDYWSWGDKSKLEAMPPNGFDRVRYVVQTTPEEIPEWLLRAELCRFEDLDQCDACLNIVCISDVDKLDKEKTLRRLLKTPSLITFANVDNKDADASGKAQNRLSKFICALQQSDNDNRFKITDSRDVTLNGVVLNTDLFQFRGIQRLTLENCSVAAGGKLQLSGIHTMVVSNCEQSLYDQFNFAKEPSKSLRLVNGLDSMVNLHDVDVYALTLKLEGALSYTSGSFVGSQFTVLLNDSVDGIKPKLKDISTTKTLKKAEISFNQSFPEIQKVDLVTPEFVTLTYKGDGEASFFEYPEDAFSFLYTAQRLILNNFHAPLHKCKQFETLETLDLEISEPIEHEIPKNCFPKLKNLNIKLQDFESKMIPPIYADELRHLNIGNFGSPKINVKSLKKWSCRYPNLNSLTLFTGTETPVNVDDLILAKSSKWSSLDLRIVQTCLFSQNANETSRFVKLPNLEKLSMSVNGDNDFVCSRLIAKKLKKIDLEVFGNGSVITLSSLPALEEVVLHGANLTLILHDTPKLESIIVRGVLTHLKAFDLNKLKTLKYEVKDKTGSAPSKFEDVGLMNPQVKRTMDPCKKREYLARMYT